MKGWLKQGIIFGVLALATSLVSGGFSAVEAASCAAGATCTVELTDTNVTGVNVDIRVTINNTGSNTILTVTFISDNISNTPLGIDQFGYNSTTTPSALPAGWSLQGTPPSPNPMDSFGTFTHEIDNPGGTDLTFSFTLAGLVTSFGDNTTGSEFAAHIRYSGSCSGFVADGTSIDNGPAGGCTTTVPEPSTLLLLGTAITGVGLVGRRWLWNKFPGRQA